MNREDVINSILCTIASQTRTHPAVLRGVSVRGAIALKEVLWALSVLRGSVTEECIRRAAMITLPPRMHVREGEDKSAVVEDIVNAVLGGMARSGSHNKGAVFKEGFLFPEELLESLQEHVKTFPWKNEQQDQEEESLVLEEEWAREFLNKGYFLKKGKQKTSFSLRDSDKHPRNSLKGKLERPGAVRDSGHLPGMPYDGDRPGKRVPKKELVNTILEFMEVQDSQWGRSIDFQQMYIYYHMKANRAQEAISPEKRDYHGLMMLIQDLEQEGILKNGKGKDHGFALSGEALQMLFDFFFEKDITEKGFPGSMDFRKALFNERRHEVRKYTSGDAFRNISFRHTLRELVRRKKKPSEVTRSDFRVFLQQPLKRACDIVLCVDTSASMASHHKLMYARLASMGLASRAINEGNRVALVTFDNSGRAVVPFHREDMIRDYLVRLAARGNTNMVAGIGRANRLFFLDRSRKQKHIFLITDGCPTALSAKHYERLSGFGGKNLSEESVILEVKKAASLGIIVSVVHIIVQGEEANTRFVKRLAFTGKGRIYPIQVPEGFKAFTP